MRIRGILTSTLFHIIVIVALTVGIHFQPERDVIMPHAITVELAKIDKKTQTPVPVIKPVIKQPDKPKPKPKPPEPDKPKVAPTNTSSTPVAPLEKPDKPEKVEEPPEPVKPKPKPDKKSEVPPPPKKEEVNKKPKPQPERDFGSVLKNLSEVEEVPEDTDDQSKETKNTDVGHNAPLGAQLTMSEVDALRRQLEGCWNVPIGARDVADMIIDVNLIVNQDKTVRQASIVNTSRYNKDSFYRAVADTAVRAVLSPGCSPLLVPDGKYEMWKNIIIEFNPREMF